MRKFKYIIENDDEHPPLLHVVRDVLSLFTHGVVTCEL